ncbi:hypothetical protein RCXUPER_208 [Rhodobacter phage RcXuper]|nr:hypothetical protein RCXUPER_208 [Rhodobacter phage RcXuper]
MGIQDKIFDVEAALEAHGDASALEDFRAIMSRFYDMEEVLGRQNTELAQIKDAFAVFKRLLK